MGAANTTLQARTKEEYFYELNMEKFKVFKTQNPATDDFDVVFDLNGKKLYAHKFKLSSVSSTFEVMLSERWTTPNQPIVIKDFSFNDFKEFITFLYSGECSFTNDNIFNMVDMAEFYDVKVFKEACQIFLNDIKLNHNNIYQILELAYRYSMEDLKKNAFDFVSKNILLFIQAAQFQSLEKPVMQDIIEENQNSLQQELLFGMVYKWAEKQAIEKRKSNDNMNLNDAIKEEMNDFMPLFKFQFMNPEFLTKFVANKDFFFTGTQLNDILMKARYLITITDGYGKMMKGVLNSPDIDKVYNVIQSQKNILKNYNFWITKQQRPSTPSYLFKKNQIEYYLVYDSDGDLHLKRGIEINHRDYLLAEMIAENGFKLVNMKII